jgi:hypothetical protein
MLSAAHAGFSAVSCLVAALISAGSLLQAGGGPAFLGHEMGACTVGAKGSTACCCKHAPEGRVSRGAIMLSMPMPPWPSCKDLSHFLAVSLGAAAHQKQLGAAWRSQHSTAT